GGDRGGIGQPTGGAGARRSRRRRRPDLAGYGRRQRRLGVARSRGRGSLEPRRGREDPRRAGRAFATVTDRAVALSPRLGGRAPAANPRRPQRPGAAGATAGTAAATRPAATDLRRRSNGA